MSFGDCDTQLELHGQCKANDIESRTSSECKKSSSFSSSRRMSIYQCWLMSKVPLRMVRHDRRDGFAKGNELMRYVFSSILKFFFILLKYCITSL